MTLIYSEPAVGNSESSPTAQTQHKNVLVVTGGAGPERQGSLTSASHAAEALRALGHLCSVRDLNELAHAELRRYDVAFLAIHGWYGEDGKLQGTLDLAGVQYNGSGVAASAVAMHKPLCNRIAESAELNVPSWVEFNARDTRSGQESAVFERLGRLVFLKPTSGGGSIGAGIVGDEVEFAARLAEATTQGISMMACRRIVGTDVTVGLIEVAGKVVVLPPLATYYQSEFYDYSTKHDPQLRRHECPPRMRGATLDLLSQHALRMFHAIGCHGYARVDFLVDADGTPWFLEINTLPGLSRQGNLATMAHAHGWGYEELIDRVLTTAVRSSGYRP